MVVLKSMHIHVLNKMSSLILLMGRKGPFFICDFTQVKNTRFQLNFKISNIFVYLKVINICHSQVPQPYQITTLMLICVFISLPFLKTAKVNL